MAQFNHKKLIAMIAPLGLVGGMALSMESIADNHNRYAIDASKGVVKNSAGECWITRGGIKERLEACGDVMMAPDSDGDGVTDDKDRCPDTPRGAPVDATGCPLDSDGDGVPDYLDVCPGTPAGAKVDEQGCEIKMMQPQKVEVVIDNILLFDFDSAELKGGATDVLDSSYAKFKGNDAVRSVTITGHTDSIGSEAYNQGLSERRANAVRDYLISQGADGGKLKARGAGESMPAYTNETEAGRSMNRRVEFGVMMK